MHKLKCLLRRYDTRRKIEQNSRPLCASRPNAVKSIQPFRPRKHPCLIRPTSSPSPKHPPPSRSHPDCNRQQQSQPQRRSELKGKNSRDILYPILILDNLPNLVGQLARDLDGVYPGDIAVEALPLGDPAPLGVGEGDDALEDLGGAGLDLVLGVCEVEEVVAVGAAFVAEALFVLFVSFGSGERGLGGTWGWGG